jgi:hypothetical protein
MFIRLRLWFKIEAWIELAILTAELFEANGSIVYWKKEEKCLYSFGGETLRKEAM